MRESNSHNEIVRYYRIFAIKDILTVFLLCCSLIGIFLFQENFLLFITFIILSVFFFGLSIQNALLVFEKQVYYDQFSKIGNAAFVIRKAVFHMINKKLHHYYGIFINLREFKYINQRYGLENGDKILKMFSKELNLYAKRHRGTAARLGGDNFFMLIHRTELEAFLKYVNKRHFVITVKNNEEDVYIQSYCGVYEIPKDAQIRNIIFYASIALAEAKKSVNTSVSYFNEYMLRDFTREKDLIASALDALRDNEFVPYYQPKVDANTKELCGAEALVRWQKSDGTLISPNQFVPALEKAGMITKIDFRVFEMVCRDIRKWIDNGIEPKRISTNFSKLHLKDPRFVDRIIDIKNIYNIDGKYLEVELTESAGIDDFKIIRDCTERLLEQGIHISIDDFGTGYSSLSMLQSIKAEVVKMDKSFLDNSFGKGGEQFILDVIGIVKHQNEKILFEGVETIEQYYFLKNNQVDYIQGYFFDKPLPHDDFEKRLKNPVYQLESSTSGE